MFNTTTRSYQMTDAGGNYDWMFEALDVEDYKNFTDKELADWADTLIEQGIESDAETIRQRMDGQDSDVIAEKIADMESDLRDEKQALIAEMKKWIGSAFKPHSTFEAVIAAVSEVDGMEAAYGGNDYRISVWDDMEGGYNLSFRLRNSGIEHDSEHAETAEAAINRMKEFNADAAAWYPVEFGG